MYQRHELLAALSPEDFSASLAACGLSDKDEYTDDEGDKFLECRVLIERGKSYDEVAHLLQQNGTATNPEPQPTEVDTQPKAKKSRNGKKAAKTMDFDSLRTWVSEEVGTRISPIELGHLIQACALPDQEEYTQDECYEVREAADIYKNQGKSYAEVADCVGKTNEGLNIDADVQEILGMIGSAALSTEEELLQVLNKLSAKRGQAISAMYERLLLTHTAQQLRERQQARDSLTKFGEQLEAFVEGKSSIRTVRMVSPPALDQTTWKSLPESSDKS